MGSSTNNNLIKVDHQEIEKFGKFADLWWNPDGAMWTLHAINPLRTRFITEHLDVQGRRILDVGCGGGILTETLARLGAHVVGIDLSEALIEMTRQHAIEQGLEIDYRLASIDKMAGSHAAEFDVITCMEFLEHVPEPDKIVATCSGLLKPNGHAFFSTINRTLKSFIFAILGAEYILRMLPKGTHTYDKLVRPNELRYWAEQNSLEFVSLASLIYNPFNKKFKISEKEDISYMTHFVKNGTDSGEEKSRTR